MINNVMNNIMFFKIANHNITVVGSDGAYTKPLTSDYIAISPGQTIDLLLQANQNPSHYYMASRVHAVAGSSSTSTTTAIVEYTGNYSAPPSPLLPTLPAFNDMVASDSFTARLRSLASKDHPVDVPQKVDKKFLFTLSINTFACPSCTVQIPGQRLKASINNITFVQPKTDILQAYYNRIRGVYGDDFPKNPPFSFNYTAANVSDIGRTPRNGTEVRVLEYNTSVEIVFQGTNLVSGIYHPMHLHGYSFYVVGMGSGNFDRKRDPLRFNLVDPPLQNTIAVPRNGWTAIRFKANNPGTYLH